MQDVLFGVAMTPVILAVVQAFKEAEFPDKYSWLLSLFLGMLLFSLAAMVTPGFTPQTVFVGMLQGVSVGLAASGLYSGVKNMAEKRVVVRKDKG